MVPIRFMLLTNSFLPLDCRLALTTITRLIAKCSAVELFNSRMTTEQTGPTYSRASSQLLGVVEEGLLLGIKGFHS